MILVVEDQTKQREWLAKQLRELGYEVRTAANKDEALERVRDKAPKFVLLDLMLPSLEESKNLVEAFQRLPGTAATKIVIATGLLGDGPLQWPGVVGVLRKPFTVEQVTSELAQLSGVRMRPKIMPPEEPGT